MWDHDGRFWMGFYLWSVESPDQRFIRVFIRVSNDLSEIIRAFGIAVGQATGAIAALRGEA